MDDVLNLQQFIEFTSSIRSDWEQTEGVEPDIWFRGITSVDHKLIPGLHRGKVDATLEATYRRTFQTKAWPFISEVYRQPTDEWEWLFLMQHYGLPTRLLDWTESSLVALYFACDTDDDESDSAVWMLNPWALNELNGSSGEILNRDHELSSEYLKCIGSSAPPPNLPQAIESNYNSRRIAAQRGKFTIHGVGGDGIENYLQTRDHLAAVRIKSDVRPQIVSQLRSAGVTTSTIFPELSGLCRELVELWSG